MRVTDRLEIQTSRRTILRRIMALPTEPVGAVSQIGIDDFAFRRGRKFGTIIVDLRTHQVLDVLPDRTADTSLPQNNGLIEGKVNKLKLIKRMMFGRAEFPLLRQRVLHAL